MSLFFGVVLAFAAVALWVLNLGPQLRQIKNLGGAALAALSLVAITLGGFSYNDAGYNQHVRTIFGSESAVTTTGWYFSGWGSSTQYPHFITVAHTSDADAGGTNISPPYRVRTADNWNGDVTQTTRFAIPQDEAQFLDMARALRSPERLVTSVLRPAVTASLDSVANMFTMEEYYAGGQRDQFKTEYQDAITKGRARVRQTTRVTSNVVTDSDAAANDLDATDEGDSVGKTEQRRVVMVPVTDAEGNVIRSRHDYTSYGITVASAILEQLDPDDRFEDQIEARRQAASRRIIAQEERREQEEQRLLAIQRGQTNIATRQAEAEVAQIEKTTNAETTRQLAVIAANQRKEEAVIAKETAEIDLERARIQAETQETLADAAAYERRAILEADNALTQRLEAWVTSQQYWAEAAAKINVPTTVFAGGSDGATGNALGTVEQFMQMMTANAAQQIGLNTQIAIEGTTPK